ncbi:YARHG domain-containing protein [Dysgonomonas sp. 25]|uniref:YARHG domain-containing protein n=1 Tax=Dysgonomonas sp. 25 TaxID=2302933 RepID=UPI0013D1BEC2|nr:YARHG domain-containing protein [Dysgonomonas sp. 25]NDV70407.1 YARHG domain-containing protein [Dysgonomonas sp. 25]
MKLKIQLLFVLLLVSLTGKLSAQADCSQCSETLIRPVSLAHKTLSQLNMLKAELYARRGFSFKNEHLDWYFSGFDWYAPLQRNVTIDFNEIEKENVARINQAIKNKLAAMVRPDESPAKRSSEDVVGKYFAGPLRKSLNLVSYDIRDVYFYSDDTGKHSLILSSIPYDPYDDQGDVFNHIIKVNYCKVEGDRFMYSENELTDLVMQEAGEIDIRFLTQYTSIDDVNGDGIANPIVVYAVMCDEGYRNGWVKVVVKYGGVLSTVYISNSAEERNPVMSITSGYYALPVEMKGRVKSLLLRIEKDGFLILPDDWEQKMG